MIVELQSDKHMSLVAQNNIVYLDKGQADGVRAGDCLEIFRIGWRPLNGKIGEVKVLSSEPYTAAAVVSKAVSRALTDRLRTKQGSSVQQALRSDQREEDLPAVTVQPVSATNGVPSVPVQQGRTDRENDWCRPLRGGVRLNLDDLADQLEYESGEVKVKPAGVPVLAKVAEYLATAADSQQVRVEGHSDNMEIGPSLNEPSLRTGSCRRHARQKSKWYLVEKAEWILRNCLRWVMERADRWLAMAPRRDGRKPPHRDRAESLEAEAPPQAVKSPCHGSRSQDRHRTVLPSWARRLRLSIVCRPISQSVRPVSSDASGERARAVSDGGAAAPVDSSMPTPTPGS